MSQYGPSSSSSNIASSSKQDLTAIEAIYQEFHEKMSAFLHNKKPESNELTHVQALHQRLAEDGQDLTRDDFAKIAASAAQQAGLLIEAGSLNRSFAETQRQVNIFLEVIRKNLNSPEALITPELVKTQLTTLLTQFEAKALARSYAVTLSDKLHRTMQDIARLEAEKPVAASAPASSNAAPAPNLLEIAKAAKIQLEKDLQKAISDAEKNTDIPAELRDSFIAFAKHTTSNDRILQAITYEIQFPSTQSIPTAAQVDVSNARWQAIEAGRKARLLDVDKSGGKFAGIRARVESWNAKMPVALSSEEMAHRDAIVPYQEGETPDDREERIKQVAGQPYRRTQIEQKAVAKDSGSKKNQKVAPVAKQLHELDDEHRREFERLGIKSLPKNQQSVAGAIFRSVIGAECWNEQFEEPVSPKSPNPPRRTSMETHTEEGVPVPHAFPPRKAFYTAALTPLLQRHLQLGANSGDLVGRWVKKGDAYSEKVETPDMVELTKKLARVKI